MKQILTSAAILLLTVFTTNVKAQISEKDKVDTKNVFEAAAKAFKNMDATAMSDIFTGNGTHIDPMGKITHGKAALVDYFTNLFSYFKSQPKPDKSTITQSDWNSRLIAPGVILTNYIEETTNFRGDKASSIKYSFAVVLVKKNGRWLAEQVAMTPVIEMSKL